MFHLKYGLYFIKYLKQNDSLKIVLMNIVKIEKYLS